MSALKELQQDLQKRATGVVTNVLSIGKSKMAYRIELTEQDIQEKIEQYLPLSHTKYRTTFYFSEPRVRLYGQSREIGLYFHIDAQAPFNVKISGAVKLRGEVVYEPVEGAFYIKRLRIDLLDIQGASPSLTNNIKRVAQIAMSTALSHLPVYRLNDEGSSHKLAKLALRSMRVNGDKLEIEMGL